MKVLVIGIGGIGSEIVCSIEKKANTKERHQNIRFCVMDTDVNTLARLKREDFRGGIVQLSENNTVEEYRDRNKYSGAWFLQSNILDRKPMTEGAGQVRAVSRLAFEDAVAKGKAMQPIYEAISELHSISLETGNNVFRIVIVTSLAGGTGSGTFLPLALHLRKYYEDHYTNKSLIIRGMFLTAECFESIIRGNAEKKSLRGNSYAAIKELDAFMKAADGYLPSRYSVRMVNPKVYSETNLYSFDYCYLFGARNEQSQGITTFSALKEYVVKCIYAQIIGPLYEIYNSIEDNVLKSTMTDVDRKEAEFCRYCASGIRYLEYPYGKIVDYLTYKKIRKVFDEEWMLVEKAYAREEENRRRRRSEGEYVERIEMRQFYLQHVRTAGASNRFLSNIRKETMRNGRSLGSLYLEALMEDIRECQKDILESCREEQFVCENILHNAQDKHFWKKSELLNLINTFEELVIKSKRAIKINMESLAQRYFGQLDWKNGKTYHYFYWMQEEGELLHMNAVRYYLYQILEEAEEKRKSLNNQKDMFDELGKQKKRISLNFGESGSTDDNSGVDKALKHFGENWFWNWMHRKRWLRIIKLYEGAMVDLEDACFQYLLANVLELVVDHLGSLSDHLEKFYERFYVNREWYNENLEILSDSLFRKKNGITRYVCSSEGHLDYLLERVEDIHKDRQTNSELSQIILGQIVNVEEMETGTIDDIYRVQIVDSWRQNLKSEYADVLDINIIEAVIKEGEYFRQGDRRYRFTYLENVLMDIWDKTVPSLLIRDQQKSDNKYFCTFHKSLLDMEGRAGEIVVEQLKQKNGVETEGDIDKYSVIFYNVLYNLRALAVNEFAVGRPEIEDCLYESGDAFRAYYDVVSMQNKTKLSPHIDKNWSNISIMPDLNKDFTERREKDVYKAISWGWVNGNIGDTEAVRDRCRQYFENYSMLKDIQENIKGTLEKAVTDDQGIEKFTWWKRKEGAGEIEWIVRLYDDTLKNKWDSLPVRLMVEAAIELDREILHTLCGDVEYEAGFRSLILGHAEYLWEGESGGRQVCIWEIRHILQNAEQDDLCLEFDKCIRISRSKVQ